jgi:hypothetical protein
MVRQVLCTRVRRCNLLLFRQLSAVYDDAIRHWRILHQKSILPCGAYHCAAGKLPSGAPAPPPAYLTPAVSEVRNVSCDGSYKRSSLCVAFVIALHESVKTGPGPLRWASLPLYWRGLEDVEKAIDLIDAKRLTKPAK